MPCLNDGQYYDILDVRAVYGSISVHPMITHAIQVLFHTVQNASMVCEGVLDLDQTSHKLVRLT